MIACNIHSLILLIRNWFLEFKSYSKRLNMLRLLVNVPFHKVEDWSRQDDCEILLRSIHVLSMEDIGRSGICYISKWSELIQGFRAMRYKGSHHTWSIIGGLIWLLWSWCCVLLCFVLFYFSFVSYGCNLTYLCCSSPCWEFWALFYLSKNKKK